MVPDLIPLYAAVIALFSLIYFSSRQAGAQSQRHYAKKTSSASAHVKAPGNRQSFSRYDGARR